MEYIEASEFLKQPEKVQEAFIKWWTDNYTGNDLVYNNEDKKTDIYKNVRGIFCLCPLFTEGQLRKFIEEKSGKIESIGITGHDYSIATFTRSYGIDYAEDLLQAYWLVACKIAEGI